MFYAKVELNNNFFSEEPPVMRQQHLLLLGPKSTLKLGLILVEAKSLVPKYNFNSFLNQLTEFVSCQVIVNLTLNEN